MPNYSNPYGPNGSVDPDFLKKPYKEKNTLVQNFSMTVPCRRWKFECPGQEDEAEAAKLAEEARFWKDNPRIDEEGNIRPTPQRGVGII